MQKANTSHRHLVATILAAAFADNKSVNYIIKQDSNSKQRIFLLMLYSFDKCMEQGDVFLSDDNEACALVVYPEKKAKWMRSFIPDLKFIFSVVGLKNVARVLKREAALKAIHPKALSTYLWFIGVLPQNQNKGTGTLLLRQIIKQSQEEGRLIFLETSVERNIPWYTKNGFAVYKELDFGYRLYCMKNI